MQTLRFGLALDGQSGWAPRDGVGISTLGPIGFLTLLETQLGLLRVQVSRAERIVQYRDCLAKARTGHRFYERSFSVDDLGTAATLLAWRDDWYEAGWTGRAPADAPARILDMAEVERLAAPHVAPGVGQRLAEVAAVLALHRPQVDLVELADPFDTFPLAWRLVLALLPVQSMANDVPEGVDGTLLREVQDALVSVRSGAPLQRVPWRDDGSVVVVRGESRLAAAQWVARQLPPGDPGQAIVAPSLGSMLDAAFEAAGRPRLGLTQASVFRPSLQLLPLAMRLLWAPVDFDALVQFLTHASHPLPWLARRRIAERLVESPGLGGTAWDEMKQKIAVDLGERVQAVMGEIEYWVEHERHDPAVGAPLPAVVLRVTRLADFFRARLGDTDDTRRASWNAGFVQATGLRQSLLGLIDQGLERIAPEALDKLLSQVSAQGASNPLRHPQAGAVACVTQPGALIEPFDSVTWWQLAAGPLPEAWPLSRAETDALHADGVEVQDIAERLARDARACLRPILKARRRLVLVLPRPGEEVHPVWVLVSRVLDGVPVRPVEHLLVEPSDSPDRSPVLHRPLPARRRWWQLPEGVTVQWPSESSFTSLEPLLFNPSLWVLRYPAGLKPSALLRPPELSRLLGNLAHRLVERLYRVPGSIDWGSDRVGQWFDAHLDAVVDEEGALLRNPVHRAELEGFRLRFRPSLLALHGILQAADASRVEPERALGADTTIGRMKGSSDLVITTASNRLVVIDMKWSGSQFYRKKMAEHTHLQLAVYAHLLERETGAWPAVGYYVLRDATLLMSDPGLFPGLDGAAHPEGTTAGLWQQAVETWRWRKGQLDAGSIEVVMDGIEADADSAPPEGALPMVSLKEDYNPFARLTGWDEA